MFIHLSIDNNNIVLRGFGVFYGSPSRGGIFLPRHEFQPRFTPLAELGSPPWEEKDLPSLKRPTRSQRNHCLSLTLDLFDWIRSHETTILEELGIEYRRQYCSNGTTENATTPSLRNLPLRGVNSPFNSLPTQMLTSRMRIQRESVHSIQSIHHQK